MRGLISRSSQLCSDPTILGVTYDLEQYLLKIKRSRKKELFDEISMILEHEELSPGQAGKLRGKLALVPRYEVRQCMLATHFL